MRLSNKKILVTGGTGFIGSHLIRKLVLKGFNVVLLKRKRSSTWRISDIENQIKIYNINAKNNLDDIFKKEKIQGIIHLSAKYIKILKATKEIQEINNINITFPTLLLEAAVKNEVSFFINTGTFMEYELSGKIAENASIQPYNYYSATKVAFESILKYYAHSRNIKACTLKLFTPYGEKDNPKIVTLIAQSFYKGKELELTKGYQKLSFTYITDIVDAYYKAILFLGSKKYSQYEAFNIGNTKNYSIREIVSLMKGISNKPNKVRFGLLKILNDDVVNVLCDSEKAKNMLKWQPIVGIEQGLKKTYTYFSNVKTND